jgi:hypothetical protein
VVLDGEPAIGVAAAADGVPGRALPQCAACRAVADATHRFFTWFAIDAGTDSPVIATLRSGGGMCAPHTRAAMSQDGAAARLTTVYRHTLPVVRDRLAARAPLPARCPACDAGRRAAGAALAGAVASHASTGTVLCVAHLQQLAGTHRRHLPRFASRTAAAMSDGPNTPTLLLEPDENDDAAARRRLRSLLPTAGMLGEEAGDWVDTQLRLEAILRVDVCPLCLAVGQHERLYLSWLAEAIRTDPIAVADEPGVICPAHLADLRQVAAPAGRWALRREQSQWQARLSMALVGSSRRVRSKLIEALRAQPCRVCRAIDDAVNGHAGLLIAALGGSLAVEYERATGLCVRHVAQLPIGGAAAALVRRVARGRLDGVIAELDEASRKTAWHTRHERSGPERTAWLRAAVLLDGWVFLGGRPRTTPMPGPHAGRVPS